MNPVIETILTRRAVRKYEKQPVTRNPLCKEGDKK